MIKRHKKIKFDSCCTSRSVARLLDHSSYHWKLSYNLLELFKGNDLHIDFLMKQFLLASGALRFKEFKILRND